MEDLIEKKDGELLQKHACDSSDYLIAVACGAVSGLVDIFLVGAPSQSVIGKWTDAQVDEAVKKFAEKSGWSPRPGKEGNVASAIGYLERQYKVNYDQRYSADVGGAFNMSTKNHHISVTFARYHRIVFLSLKSIYIYIFVCERGKTGYYQNRIL